MSTPETAAPVPPAKRRPPKAWTTAAEFAGSQWARARRSPVTLVLAALPLILGIATGSLLNGPSEDLEQQVGAGISTLQDGKVWTLLTAALFEADLFAHILAAILTLIVGSLVERRWGSLRMVWIALVIQLVGIGVGLGVVYIAGASDSWTWAEFGFDSIAIGVTPLLAGLLMAFSGGASVLWRRRIRTGVIAACLVLLLYGGQLQDWLRLSCALVGLLIGVFVLHQGERHLSAPSSRRETRVLVAVVVAATALGPLVIAINYNDFAPLSVLADLYLGPDAVARDDNSIAEIVVSVVPALLLLVLAAGLRRGRLFAWWATLVFHVVFLVVGALYAVDYYQWIVDNDLLEEDYSWFAYLTPLVIVPLVVTGILLFTRKAFTAKAPAGTYRSFGLIVLATTATLWAIYVIVGTAISDQFVSDGAPPSFGELLIDFPLRLLPPGYLYIIDGPEPTTGLAQFLVDWIPVVFWAIVLTGLLRTFVRAGVNNSSEDAARARAILEQSGITTLAYMTTWEGNSYWFSRDGNSYVAYRVEGGVAITTGDPVGPRDDVDATVREFVEFCTIQGWTPCLYSTTTAVKEATDGLGWPSLQVAEETVLPLGSLVFSGKKFQDIRSSISRATKAGITAEWIVFPQAPLSIRDQIEAISEEWVSDKALPEMGFTLGGIDELDDENVRCLIAVDTDRTIHGVTSWMPSYRDGAVVGWTLDFMRRRSKGEVKGIMEFLIGTAALDVQKEGAEFLSMSGAPLAQGNPSDEQAGVQKMLEVIGKTMEPVYGFRSLLRFKAKFQPVYEPMYMCYPETAALPRIGLGISHAYLPHLTVGQAVRMVGELT